MKKFPAILAMLAFFAISAPNLFAAKIAVTPDPFFSEKNNLQKPVIIPVIIGIIAAELTTSGVATVGLGALVATYFVVNAPPLPSTPVQTTPQTPGGGLRPPKNPLEDQAGIIFRLGAGVLIFAAAVDGSIPGPLEQQLNNLYETDPAFADYINDLQARYDRRDKVPIPTYKSGTRIQTGFIYVQKHGMPALHKAPPQTPQQLAEIKKSLLIQNKGFRTIRPAVIGGGDGGDNNNGNNNGGDDFENWSLEALVEAYQNILRTCATNPTDDCIKKLARILQHIRQKIYVMNEENYEGTLKRALELISVGLGEVTLYIALCSDEEEIVQYWFWAPPDYEGVKDITHAYLCTSWVRITFLNGVATIVQIGTTDEEMYISRWELTAFEHYLKDAFGEDLANQVRRR